MLTGRVVVNRIEYYRKNKLDQQCPARQDNQKVCYETSQWQSLITVIKSTVVKSVCNLAKASMSIKRKLGYGQTIRTSVFAGYAITLHTGAGRCTQLLVILQC